MEFKYPSLCPDLGDLRVRFTSGVLGLLSKHKPGRQVCAQPMCVETKTGIRGGRRGERHADHRTETVSVPGLSSTHLIQFQWVVTGLGEKKARVRAPREGGPCPRAEGEDSKPLSHGNG